MILPEHVAKPDSNIYLSDDYIVIDVETTNLDKGDPTNPNNKLLKVQYKLPGHDTVVMDWGVFDVPASFLAGLENAPFLVGHNIKFDLGWLAKAGLDLSKVVVWDTMLGEYMIAGNVRVPLSMDATLDRYGFALKDNFISTSIKAGICPSVLPDSLLTKYAYNDVEKLVPLFIKQRGEIYAEGLENVLYTACLFTPVLTDIELSGMQLDCERVNAVADQVREQYDEALAALSELAPDTNFNSPIQMANLLYDVLGFKEPTNRKGEPIRTATGRRKADIHTIMALSARNKKQRKFVDLYHTLADLSAKLEKALDKMQECCTEDGGLMYGSFNQTVTRTHRLSSNGKKYKIQFQNMFREFKPLFKAKEDGWEIGEADGSQLEFRVAAFLGQDKQAMYDIDHGVDVHQNTADKMTKSGQETNRQDAKAHTFKPLYGGNSGTKAEVAYYDWFRERYHGIAYTQEEWRFEVLRTECLRLPTGLRFYWPGTRQDRNGYISNTTAISNYPIQYFATGEIIPVAVTYLWHRLRSHGARTYLVNTIHDSAIAEVHPEERELFKELSVQSFTHDVYNYLRDVYGIDFNVTLDAEVKIKPNWSDNDTWRNKWLSSHKA